MSKSAVNHISKVVVFDLDETLGYFIEFGIFYDMVVKYLNPQQSKRLDLFCGLLDLYPEVLRPNVWSVFKYLIKKKEKGFCSKILIYTNNQGPKEWTIMIKTYIHKKLNYELFDKIIGAFKINGIVREICRTTSDKTTSDLVRCAKLPNKTQICFVDDIYYENMDNVYYIKVNPYIHNISINVMVNRFLNHDISSSFGITISKRSQFIEYMRIKIKQYKYNYVTKSNEEYDIDKIVTKQLMILLQEFFKSN